MALKDLIVGAHIWFARNGATIGAQTVSETVLPVFSATKAQWLKLGSVEEFEPRKSQNVIERRAPISGGGRYETRRKIPLANKLELAFSLQEFEKINFEMLFGAASIGGSGDFVPNSRRDFVRGWLHLENCDQENNKLVDLDAWVELDQEPFRFGEHLNPHALIAEVLGNTLNAGVLTNL